MKTLNFQSLSFLLPLVLVSTVHASNGHKQGVGKTPETLFVVASGVDLEIDEHRPEVVSMTAIHLRTDLVVEGAQSESGLFQFALPDGETYVVHYKEAYQGATGTWVWKGEVEGVERGEVCVAVKGQSAAGIIDLVDQRYWIEAMRPHDGLHRLLVVDSMLQGTCGVDESHQVVHPESVGISYGAPSGSMVADVLVAFLPGVSNNLGGQDGAIALAEIAVVQANVAYANSLIPLELSLAAAQETAQGGTGDLNQMLSLLRHPSDGWYDEMHSLRDSVGADFVSLLTGAGGGTSYCGFGYIMNNVSPGFASDAFSVLKYSCVAFDTFAHELGHNMGCNHDRQSGVPGAGAFTYSFGYRTPGATTHRTIMAYPPGDPINYFSSPDITYGGSPLGVADPANNSADNARTIRETAPTFTQFRCGAPDVYGDSMVTSQWAELQLDWTGTPLADGTGGFNVLVRNGVPNQFGILFYGSNSADVPFMGGNRYVGFPLTRMPVVQVTAGGMAFFDWIGHAQPVPGVAQFLQFWQRDPNNMSGFNIVMSNGVRVDPCN